MSKVCLYLSGVDQGITTEGAAKALAQLYNKPVGHFELHCHHLFVLKKPYKLINSISPENANQHKEKLLEIGIQCTCEALPVELSLTPLEATSEESGRKCPACEQLSNDPTMCSECAVNMDKFLAQQSIDDSLKAKIASAESSHQRELKAQQLADEQAKVRKPPAETLEDPSTVTDDDVFSARYVDKKSNNILYSAIAGAFLAAVGAGYFAHTLGIIAFSEEDAQEVAVVEGGPQSAENEISLEVSKKDDSAENEVIYDATVFGDWRKYRFEVDKVKRQLGVLDAAVGMSSTMLGLVVGIEEPLIQIIGMQHLAQLEILAKNPQAQVDVKSTPEDEFEQLLARTPLLIQSLPNDTEKIFATLSMAETYDQLGRVEEFTTTMESSLPIFDSIIDQADAQEQVVALSMLAEFHAKYGAYEKSENYFNQAVVSAKTIDENHLAFDGAIPFLARSKARAGQFADAHAFLGDISNEKIRQDVTDYIQKHAISESVEIPAVSGASNEEMFADDPELMLLFENDKIMKENAEKLSKFIDR